MAGSVAAKAIIVKVLSLQYKPEALQQVSTLMAATGPAPVKAIGIIFVELWMFLFSRNLANTEGNQIAAKTIVLIFLF